MNTPTNHEQLSKQEGDIWTLLQTMNSSQNKREEYEHSYKPRTTLKIRDRNMNTPTNYEQLSKQEGEIWTLLHLYKPWTVLKLKAVWWIPKPLCPTVWFLRFMDHIWGFYFPDCTLRYISTSLKNISVHKGNIRLFHPFMEYFKTKRYIHCQSNYYSWNTFLLRILNKNEYRSNGFTVLYEINEFHLDVIYTPLSLHHGNSNGW